MKLEIRKITKNHENKKKTEEEKRENEKDNNRNNYLTHPDYEKSIQISFGKKYEKKKKNIYSETGLDKLDREASYEDEMNGMNTEWPITGGMIRRKLQME